MSLAFSHDGKTLASGDFGSTIKLWDVETGKNERSLQAESERINALRFSPDDEFLASGMDPVQLWNAVTGKRKAIIEDDTMCLAFSPKGELLASAGRDGIVRLWQSPSGREGRSLVHKEDGMVWSVAFSPDGKTLASAGKDSAIKLWDVETGKNTTTINGHTDEVNCIAFSPDGTLLASQSIDRTIKLWDTATWKNTRTMTGDDDSFGFVFSPDSKTIAASEGPNVRLWDVATGKVTASWAAANLLVTCAAFSPDAKLLATGESVIKLWEFPGDDGDENEGSAERRSDEKPAAASTEVVSEDGSFRFAYPAKVPANDPAGKLTKKLLSQINETVPSNAFSDGRMTYVVMATGLPAGIDAKDELAVDRSLRFARDSQIKLMEGKLLRQKNVEKEGGRGLEFTFSHPSLINGRDEPDLFCVRLVYIKNRSYLMSAAGASSAFDRKKAEAFFDSFKLLTRRSNNEPKVDIRGPAPQVGQVKRSRMTFTFPDCELTLKVQEQTVKGKFTSKATSVKEVTILAVNAGKVTKYQTKHIQHDTTTTTTLGDKTETKDDVDELAGEVVLSEKRGGKWTHSLVDHVATEKQRKALDELADWDDEEYIPAGKHPIGQSWELDATHAKKWFGSNFTALSGKGISLLSRLITINGELCAVIESKGKFKGNMKQDGVEGVVDLDLNAVSYRSLRAGTDVAGNAEGAAKIVMTKKQGDSEMTIEIKGTFSGNGTMELNQ